MARGILFLFLLLTIQSSRNTNKKYVKSEAVDVCNLGNSLQPTAIEDIKMPPVDISLLNSPRAVVNGMERSLLGSGAHREIHSVMDIQLKLDTPKLSVEHSCELVVLQHLPSGAFADPFQLNRLKQLGAVKEVYVHGDVDLERSAKNSFNSTVEVHQRLVLDKKDVSEGTFRAEVTLPVHARYPPSSPESHFVLNITIPHVLVYCRDVTDTSTNLSQDVCILAILGDRVSTLAAQTLQWPIPSGYPDHSSWIARLTTASALVGVAAISVASKISISKHVSIFEERSR